MNVGGTAVDGVHQDLVDESDDGRVVDALFIAARTPLILFGQKLEVFQTLVGGQILQASVARLEDLLDRLRQLRLFHQDRLGREACMEFNLV